MKDLRIPKRLSSADHKIAYLIVQELHVHGKLEEYLSTLPDTCRQVLEMRITPDLFSMDQISRALGLSLQEVAQLENGALEKIRERYLLENSLDDVLDKFIKLHNLALAER